MSRDAPAIASRNLLGVIADDYTGATDVAAMLGREGLAVVQHFGVPEDPLDTDADCVVIALKTRSVPSSLAVSTTRQAVRWLQSTGVRQVYFKYCSTFDSTDSGNIGPVADALAEATGAVAVLFCPASPEHGRTTYKSYHFVEDRLLSESPLRHHPLNPMTDPDLRRVLSRQTSTPVAAIHLAAVRAGDARSLLEEPSRRTFLVADAICDNDLAALADAVRGAPLVTGGASLAARLVTPRDVRSRPLVRVPRGRAIVLSGSCSPATRAQLEEFADHPRFLLDVRAMAGEDDVVGRAIDFLDAHADELCVVATSNDPRAVALTQEEIGVAQSAALVESALGEIACAAVERGVRRILVAGGESSGAVVNGIGLRSALIGPEVAPGVPWIVADYPRPLGLVLKSGNFGGKALFRDAIAVADAS